MAERAVKRGGSEGQEPTVSPSGSGLVVPRYFTSPGTDPFDEVEWQKRSAVIQDEKGKIVFEQHDVEMPVSWSQLATNVVVSKYFRGALGSPKRESSAKEPTKAPVR